MAIKPTIIQAIPKTKIKASEYNENFERMFDYIISTANELNTFVTSQVNGMNNTLSNVKNDIRPIGQPIIRLSDLIYSDEIRLEGAEVSRTTYASLFSIYGTTYGAGNGSTTFNLPDCRNRAFWGSWDFGYIGAGLPNIWGTYQANRLKSQIQGNGHNIAHVTGAFYNADGLAGYEDANSGGNHGQMGIGFNAANCSLIYGASNTVQPNAIKFRVVTRYK